MRLRAFVRGLPDGPRLTLAEPYATHVAGDPLRAASMWDPNIGMGTVTHQNIGYLWPIGPWYWLADAAGLEAVAQAFILGSDPER